VNSRDAAPTREVTILLERLRDGDSRALERLMPVVHAELRRIARAHLRHERPWHTLQATELAHEAYLRLAGHGQHDWRDRAHFFAVASGIMRRILIDHARKRAAARRGGGAPHVPLDEAAALGGNQPEELVALDEALTRLGALDPRQERIVELRFFGGLDVAETAAVLGVSTRTVKREWSVARAWLRAELGR
jgi:RNA polymerase sigma factor (TIGR02999 family)